MGPRRLAREVGPMGNTWEQDWLAGEEGQAAAGEAAENWQARV